MLLSLIIWLPLLFALLICVLPKRNWVPTLAIVFAFAEFAVSLLLLKSFDKSVGLAQLVENVSWVPEFGIGYTVGVDGISLGLVLLTTFLTPLVALYCWGDSSKSSKGFFASIFVLEASMLGSFLALDALLFYVFFELSLIPMYYLIGVWGGPRRVYATLKFFIYTMAGSLLMLLAIIYLMFSARDTVGQFTSNLNVLYSLKIPFVAGQLVNPQTLLFFAFSIAFAVKVPLVPLHTWLPDAYAEAPTAATALLSAVMAKMGSYGFIRFVIPLFPEAAEHFAWIFMFLGAGGIVYGALVALVQPDIKRLIAYSSISHIGYVMLGLFTLNFYGVTGGIYQMLNHGITISALFLMVGMLASRTGTREIDKLGGLAKVLPIFSIVFLIATFSSIAVPMTNGFIGEFLILLGAFEADKVFAAAAVTGVILSASYMLWMVKRVFFGLPASSNPAASMRDLSIREAVILAPLVVLIFWMGLFPNHFLSWTKASVDHFITNKDNYRLTSVQDNRSPNVAFLPTRSGEKQ